ncbi:hypothetical protein ACFQZS_15625 [Mucilaginibacter calamicampi]|uniref:Uncharacterized protein n=1 Tax=Mucilaginibacter calamicampi TaxID=1302352 RepID=A0ABW2YYK2_9SPHI
MNTLKFKRFILTILLICPLFWANAQTARLDNSMQFAAFDKALKKSGLAFTFPAGFKEIKAVNNREFSFNYAMELPEKDFEIWLRVNSIKENKALLKDNHQQINVDSAYAFIIKQQALAFSDDNDWLTRPIPSFILTRYNADVGKTYLVNLKDSPVTKHYKYALMIVLAKYNTGSVFGICLTNNKGPEFFKNMFEASNCLKFKSPEKADK